MRRLRLFSIVSILSLSFLGRSANAAQDQDSSSPATFDELAVAIQKVLEKTRVPGAAVALVDRTRTLWSAGIGQADIAANRKADENTLFRQGSISKSFVSLSVLLLRERGDLDLETPLHELAPEFVFSNPWSETDPVLLVHLLSHTSGFDDIHLNEYASNDPKPLKLREGLAINPGSRTSRWRPGTHFSYSNSGPAVAAYVVEKISGQPYEEFVAENFFRPLAMPTSSFFLTPEVEKLLARGYLSDGITEAPYWHIAIRPSGALNSSAQEMANFVRMLINRGTFDGTRLLTAESITRMESPRSTLAAGRGLLVGYALGNMSSVSDGFVVFGHGGGVNAGAANYGYLPQEGLGFAYMINSSNGQALREIGQLVRRFLIRDLETPLPPQPVEILAGRLRALAGYYEPITPRQELGRFAERLLNILRIEYRNGALYSHPLFGERQELFAVTDRRFRGAGEPLPTLAFIEFENRLILQGFSSAVRGNYAKVSIPGVWLQWALMIFSFAAMASSLLFALVWAPMKLLGHLRQPSHLSLRVLPLLAVVSFAMTFAALIGGLGDPIGKLGVLSVWSGSVWCFGWLFALFSAAGMVQAVRALRWEISKAVWAHGIVVSVANCLVSGYLIYWGIIGLKTWSY